MGDTASSSSPADHPEVTASLLWVTGVWGTWSLVPPCSFLGLSFPTEETTEAPLGFPVAQPVTPSPAPCVR